VSTVALPRRFARLVKIEHTVFALPFAYIGALLAARGIPSGHDLVWITIAMVGARSVAMGLNRLIDTEIDARNPRTATRELPSGALSSPQVIAFCAIALAVYVLASFQLAHVVRWLWPIPLVGFVVYPYLKRWTWLCHLWLGAVDGLAPMGGWVAVTGQLPWEAWALGGAFRGARLSHLGTVVLLVVCGAALHLGVWYWLGIAAVTALLAYEHVLVRPSDLRRLDAAFFTVNGVIAVVLLVFVALDVGA
jgi:4-hydroxybenzoate polyprenyltransferase